METLDKVVDYYVNTKVPDGSYDNAEAFQGIDIKEAMSERIKGRIVDEIMEEKKRELSKVAKEEVEKERKKSSLIAIKELMWEAFVLAIFVGLLGNELSTLIEFFKGFGGAENHTIITVILILVFSAIVLVLYIVKFTKDIIDKFVNKKGK